jgi:hypothetical protein
MLTWAMILGVANLITRLAVAWDACRLFELVDEY